MPNDKTDPDFQEFTDLEARLMEAGAWCDDRKAKPDAQTHYYVRKNPMINMAITLCHQIVPDLARLAMVRSPIKKCLVCALFAERLEVRDRQADKADGVLNKKAVD